MPVSDVPKLRLVMNSRPNNDKIAWYVLRVTYQREIVAQEKLNAMGVESYLPLKRVRRHGRFGRFEWRVEAALHNYLFVKASLNRIKEVKTDIPYLRFFMGYDSDGERRPQFVPDKDMESFIILTSQETEMLKYLDPYSIDLTKGDRVRVLEGPFKGAEGVYMNISKKHEKCVVVQIQGVVAVATAHISSAAVEKINN